VVEISNVKTEHTEDGSHERPNTLEYYLNSVTLCMRSVALHVGLMKPDNSLRVSEKGLLKILWQKWNDVAGGLEVTAQ
jgi:hypothetical protein